MIETVGKLSLPGGAGVGQSGSIGYGGQKDLQKAVEHFLLNIPFTHHAHLVDEIGGGLWNGKNQAKLRDRARRNMKELHRYIDRDLLRLGRNFYKLKEEKRSFFVAFVETLNGYPHYHLLVRLPKQRHDINFVTGLWGSWMKVLRPLQVDMERRSVRVGRFEVGDDRVAMTKYCCKELWKAQGLENMILSSEFLTAHQSAEH